MNPYLTATYHIDSDAPEIRQFAEDVAGSRDNPVEKAICLFEAVRDGIIYDPYSFSLQTQDYKASNTLARGSGFCVPKAVLLAAAARAAGIPSRLAFADVVNHLATERLLQLMQTNVFVFHGYNELYLDGRWVKATPTFDSTLCEKFGVKALEFDGHSDAVFHAFDRAGQKHMEYVQDRGHYADVPFDEMIRIYCETYPIFLDHVTEVASARASRQQAT